MDIRTVDNQSLTPDMIPVDFLQFYNLEAYLLGPVRLRFQQQGYLSAFDFFCIVIWKANRAKSKIATRLKKNAKSATLDQAVMELTAGIYCKGSARDRLFYLLEGWEFRLPMASAILTVLYPEDFTVYDIRVCNELVGEHDKLVNISITQFDRLWAGYLQFCDAVRQAAPAGLSLRDKDRYLWGKSFAGQLQQDILDGFKRGIEDEA